MENGKWKMKQEIENRTLKIKNEGSGA